MPLKENKREGGVSNRPASGSLSCFLEDPTDQTTDSDPVTYQTLTSKPSRIDREVPYWWLSDGVLWVKGERYAVPSTPALHQMDVL